MLNAHAMSLYRRISRRWKRRRLLMFCELVKPEPGAVVIDLGGATGAFFTDNKDIVERFGLRIVVADISASNLKAATANGLETLLLDEDGFGRFKDGEFDIVFCNSVIEHVTTSKSDVWKHEEDSFFQEAFENQKRFAASIERMARRYFVQTPHVGFPIESHTWTPALFSYPHSRKKHVRRLELIRDHWIKSSIPDFNLLDEPRMRELFPGATRVFTNRVLGLPKEVIAYRA